MGRNVPQLRFPEFTAEWEEKTLGDIFTFYSTNSLSRDKLNYTGGPYKNIHYGDIHMIFPTVLNVSETEIPYINDGVKVKLTDDNFVQDGDIAIADASEDYADIGKAIEIVGVGDEKLVCGLHTLHGRDLNKVMINGFKGYLLRTPKVRRQMMTLCAGAKVLGISKDNINSVSVNIPSKEEQEKIKNLLVAYDNLIRNQEGKISALKERKQGLLKKIFTQQVRFKDQDGNDYPAWEEKTLRGICDIKMCKRVMKHDTAPTGEIPFFKIGTLGGEPDAYISRALFEELKTKYNYPLTGEVMMTCSGTTGNCIQFDGEDSYYQDSNIVWIANDKTIYNNDFLFQFFRQYKWNALEGGTIKRIYTDDVYNAKIPTPCKEEQQRIVDILSAFDKKIEIEQEILSNMQEFKKGLLQKMFI